MSQDITASICILWPVVVELVASLGYFQIQRHYSSICTTCPPSPSKSSPHSPHVTIIRPAKGLDPGLYECLASTFRQTYPSASLTIHLCVASRNDPAFPVLRTLVTNFPSVDVLIFVEDEDPRFQETSDNKLGRDSLGPNPKVRSMSRAYREAKGDIVWIIDCNVWVAKGVCERMVDALLGAQGRRKPQKLVHHLPLVVDIDMNAMTPDQDPLRLSPNQGSSGPKVASTNTKGAEDRSSTSIRFNTVWGSKGGRLEEMFMSTSHAKFYTAINTVLIAPCLVGKSNMFRRSHLDALTDGRGIDYFSHNICEDHLIGDLLWKKAVPKEVASKGAASWGNHALVFGDLAIQPIANMSVRQYMSRRVRWLRVRKYTVKLATLVEATTESFFCSALLAHGLTTHQAIHNSLGMPQTWHAFCVIWLLNLSMWATFDWTLYRKLHSAISIDLDRDTPSFCRPFEGRKTQRPLLQWIAAWLGREALAFPIWFWAVFGGATVTWRGKRFWVDKDMKVHEFHHSSTQVALNPQKARTD